MSGNGSYGGGTYENGGYGGSVGNPGGYGGSVGNPGGYGENVGNPGGYGEDGGNPGGYGENGGNPGGYGENGGNPGGYGGNGGNPGGGGENGGNPGGYVENGGNPRGYGENGGREAQLRARADAARLLFPELRDLSDEDAVAVVLGGGLLGAYAGFRAREAARLRQENETLRRNRDALRRAPVRGVSGGAPSPRGRDLFEQGFDQDGW